MQPLRVVVRSALIAVLTLVAVPTMAASRPTTSETTFDLAAFRAGMIGGATAGRSMTTLTPDPDYGSSGVLGPTDVFGELGSVDTAPPAARPAPDQPAPQPITVVLNPWRYDRSVSFYGPGFYGKRTACGLAYTTTLMGVAHRSLPCGTLVTFRNPANGRTITVPVVDRGPYVSGRTWDLTGAACTALAHCYTGPISWKYGS